MKYLIIGTAGHVDHGKSALIRALTGVETDRLKEEKLRGISIDLGFASLKIDEETMAGIVDVPGHERFLKNMLAGTGGIDFVMLVIAADEGVMPQTREHLAMLDLYGVKNGIVVINKMDKVERDWLDLVEEDIRELLSTTFLAEAPFCRVSAVTGEGLPELKQLLQKMAAETPARDSRAPFRMWIDRSFTVKGYGVVVTGSVLSGTAKIGDSLLLYPSGQTIRVRGLEWHGGKVDQVTAGQRSAINVAGADLEEIGRGMALSAPECGEISAIWDMAIQWTEEVPPGTRVRLHLGTGEYIGRIYRLKDQGAEYGRIILEHPVAAGAGDRGILRLYSPQHLLAGVLLVAPGQKGKGFGAHRAELAKALAEHDGLKVTEHVLGEAAQPLTAETIERQAGYIRKKAVTDSLAALLQAGKIRKIEGFYVAEEALQEITKKVTERLARCHREEPQRPGLPKEIVRQHTGLEEKAFEALFHYWQQSELVVAYGSDMALKSHADAHSNWQQEVMDQAEGALQKLGYQSVDAAMVGEALKLTPDKAQKIFELLIRTGVLVRMSDVCLTKMAVQEAVKEVQKFFATHPTISVAELRDLLNTSRKIAMPLLEYFDSQKYTIRDRDTRRPGNKLQDATGALK